LEGKKVPKKNKLTPKQQRFVMEYCRDLNATQAAIRAGYSPKTARSQGQRLLTNVDIGTVLGEERKKIEKRCEVSTDKTVKEIARLAFSNIGDFLTWGEGGVFLKDFNGLTPEKTACIAKVSNHITKDSRTVRFKMHPKLPALHLLMKHLGGYAPEIHSISPEILDRILGALPRDYANAVKIALKQKVGRRNGLSRSLSH